MTGSENNKNIRFDDYIDNYKHEIQESINFFGQDVDFYINLKVDLLLQLTEKYRGQLDKIDALDIGSGIGLIDKCTSKYFKTLRGVDVESGVIDKAKSINPDVEYTLYGGKKLPFENETFHLTFAVNVLHHVPVNQWQNFANEMHRVLKKGGLAFIFEHNPANPLTRKVVKECAFDRDAVLLPHKKLKKLLINSGLKIIDDAYIIFFPFQGKLFRGIEKLIKSIPMGAQQFAIGKKL